MYLVSETKRKCPSFRFVSTADQQNYLPTTTKLNLGNKIFISTVDLFICTDSLVLSQYLLLSHLLTHTAPRSLSPPSLFPYHTLDDLYFYKIQYVLDLSFRSSSCIMYTIESHIILIGKFSSLIFIQLVIYYNSK